MEELTEEECAKQLKSEIASYKWYEDRIATLEREVEFYMGEAMELQRELAESRQGGEAQNEKLRQALQKYGEHLHWCRTNNDFADEEERQFCSCGLRRLIDD